MLKVDDRIKQVKEFDSQIDGYVPAGTLGTVVEDSCSGERYVQRVGEQKKPLVTVAYDGKKRHVVVPEDMLTKIT